MLDIVEEIPFDNPNGGVWKQGFEISYSLEDYGDETLNVFVVPHSHNDPGTPKDHICLTMAIIDLILWSLTQGG